jgi:hypothetical protein
MQEVVFGTNEKLKTVQKESVAECDVSFQSETLKDITREQRERKAVKSDDAAVPEYLWEDQLLDGMEAREWNSTQLKKVRRVSTWLRSKMLRWWKRHVTTLYMSWIWKAR